MSPNILHSHLRAGFHASVNTPHGFFGEFPREDFARLCHAGKANSRFEPNTVPSHKLKTSDLAHLTNHQFILSIMNEHLCFLRVL
jgi:hypothetical protein